MDFYMSEKKFLKGPENPSYKEVTTAFWKDQYHNWIKIGKKQLYLELFGITGPSSSIQARLESNL